MPIPIIDLFAGPGGLGEGFSQIRNDMDEFCFQIKLSIEKDPNAHQTLKLRSFYRQFLQKGIPDEYYEFLRGEITLDELYNKFPQELKTAEEEAWCATLGDQNENDLNYTTNEDIDKRIETALAGEANWVLIGGPPCQAYSLVGRSRRQEKILDESKDKRVGLYKEYLRIIAIHKPAVFVMENVKGLLSARTETDSIFNKIIGDLQAPCEHINSSKEKDLTKYHIYSLASNPRGFDLTGEPHFLPKDYLIKSENYGIPQKRHRVILLGIRTDINVLPEVLFKQNLATLKDVIGNLPKLRSGITRSLESSEWVFDDTGKKRKKRNYVKLEDSFQLWKDNILKFDKKINNITDTDNLNSLLPISLGKDYIKQDKFDLLDNNPLSKWFYDAKLNGILHHESRKHLLQDIFRYYFAAKFTIENGIFPKMLDYKAAGNGLLPDHENATSGKFNDRFRVQLPNDAATTVTSHISKDGHYFIHYDKNQARSLTVREAARIQTFPDNYFFFGGRTQQYHQVGNAVPPYLAFQIAKVVRNLFQRINI